MNYFKRIETILIVILILALGAAYGVLHNKKDTRGGGGQNQTREQDSASQQVPATTIRYSGQEGRNALDILKSEYNVQTKSFGDMGEFVQAIDGVEPDSTHFWAMYVNGQQAQVGAGAYMTKSSDVIEWKLEEIK